MNSKTVIATGILTIALSACGGDRSPGPTSAMPLSSLAHSVHKGLPRPQTVVALGSYNVNAATSTSRGSRPAASWPSNFTSPIPERSKARQFTRVVRTIAGKTAKRPRSIDCGGAGLYGSELSPSESYINANQNTSGMDAVSNISGQHVYLWSGTGDTIVTPKTMNDLQTEYQKYGATVKYDNTFAAEHGWESPYGTVSCGTAAKPVHDRLGSTATTPRKRGSRTSSERSTRRTPGTLTGSLINFDQTPFGGGSNDLDTNGWVFVPRQLRERYAVLARRGARRVRAVPSRHRQRVRDPVRSRSVGGHQQRHRALSVPNDRRQQLQRLLGLVGLQQLELRAKVRHPQMAAIYNMVKQLEGGTAHAVAIALADRERTPDGDANRRPDANPDADRRADRNADADRSSDRDTDAVTDADGYTAVLAKS